MVNDPVGDLIVRLKNASMTRKASVVVPYSKLRANVLSKLSERGFVGEVGKRGKKTRKVLEVELRYVDGGASVIHDVSRLSKPGRRVYHSVKEIHPVRYGKGILMLSTPKGILTGDEARKEHVGGEALFTMW